MVMLMFVIVLFAVAVVVVVCNVVCRLFDGANCLVVFPDKIADSFCCVVYVVSQQPDGFCFNDRF